MFEKTFPFIYIGDRVVVSSRWAGDEKNPAKGKIGSVVNITHGLQSQFNRDYLIVGLNTNEGNIETWLYTLDLFERDLENLQKYKSGNMIYIDDTIEIIDKKHEGFGITGIVDAIFGVKGEIRYSIRDESIYEKMKQEESNAADKINAEVKKRIEDPSEFSKFEAIIKKKMPEEYNSIVAKNELNYFFMKYIGDLVLNEFKSKKEYLKKIRELHEKAIFYADNSSVRLVKAYPNNRNFKID
jgi:hypothetical protein